MNGRLIYHHLVETRRTSSIAIIESKRFGFSVFQALPQTLAYMMANPNPASPILSLVTNGEDFLFVKLDSQSQQYDISDKLTLTTRLVNQLYTVALLIKLLMG
jgi:hypothetical protein